MKNKDDIKAILAYFQSREDKPLQFDEEAIFSAYQKDNESQSLSIKILSVFGGILASLAFLAFLLAAGLYDSKVGFLIFGGIFIVCSVLISKNYNKIIIDTVCTSFFIVGFILIGIGCLQLMMDENSISSVSIIFIIIALGSLCIVQNYILSFISVIIINGSILMLIISNNGYYFTYIYVSLLALAVTYVFLKETTIITTSKALSKLYNPIRIGLVLSFLSFFSFSALLSKLAYTLLSEKGILFTLYGSNLILVLSIVIISIIVYLISTLFNILNITETRYKIGIYIFTVLALLPTIASPAISGAILIILLSFLVNYKTGFVLGIILFIYFISRYYYDLNFTLLTKSILLFSTGVIFIALYLLTYKKLTTNEKI